MKIYQIGDVVWAAAITHKTVIEPCPVCFGNKQVTLILGNGDQVILPCEYCQKGFDQPTGEISVGYFAEPVAFQIQIDGVEQRVHDNETEVRYYVGRGNVSSIYYNHQVADTEEEALALAMARLEAKNAEAGKVTNPKFNPYKSYTWNAGYHIREMKSHLEMAEYHRKNAIVCQERSKK